MVNNYVAKDFIAHNYDSCGLTESGIACPELYLIGLNSRTKCYGFNVRKGRGVFVVTSNHAGCTAYNAKTTTLSVFLVQHITF